MKEFGESIDELIEQLNASDSMIKRMRIDRGGFAILTSATTRRTEPVWICDIREESVILSPDQIKEQSRECLIGRVREGCYPKKDYEKIQKALGFSRLRMFQTRYAYAELMGILLLFSLSMMYRGCSYAVKEIGSYVSQNYKTSTR